MSNNILDKIVENKIDEIDKKKKNKFSFKNGLIVPKSGDIAVIAEIKLRSPSFGIMAAKREALEKAIEYEKADADCISVITDNKYFGGEIGFIKKIKTAVGLPILQKDFVIDPYQIYEAKLTGADAILLIAKIVTVKKLQEFVSLAYDIGIEPVVEVYNEEDLEKALATNAEIIGVNARDLRDFKIDVKKAAKFLARIPNSKIKIGFSGVNSRREVEIYKEVGAKAVLVGTAIMKTKDVRSFIANLK